MDLSTRLSEHLNKKYSNAYTTKASDWELFYHISGLTYLQARSIESHIKKMKSKMYISDLKNFTEMSQKLIDKYK